MAASEELDVAGVKPATAGDELVRASQSRLQQGRSCRSCVREILMRMAQAIS